ncbi:uncharacterized protein [Physcomitrium patens]|uniref:Domain X domain-containing protein n=2 Tax=Physcomitrium patens TaxID=3218 RepID=A0A2K1L3U3_PHYPA|nr:uncharacterized protein LOC112294667 isoform X1 [Physcomitrium patens]XP_024401163.1 uncharacterized protein LOC112294667 isoform X1 [Physcomitrium patens]PNR60709.1 hypothetical protein PHYPA_003502 [Physcomitrium patens]|eukprot:XP_024401155.1 uncharacterized protein LOC112294667 isoform X1 [Physcomitrella patens]
MRTSTVALLSKTVALLSRGVNGEYTCPSNWALKKLAKIKNHLSFSSGVSRKHLTMAPNSTIVSRYTVESFSCYPSLLASARHQELVSILKAVLPLQDRMFTSLSARRGQIPEESKEFDTAQGSDIGSGSELGNSEWEDDSDIEPEDLDNAECEDLESDTESSTKFRDPRKSKGRESDYSMRIEAPIDEIYALLHSRGFITPKQKRPTPNDSVLGQEDHRIITWYRRVSIGLLNYYSSCDNFLKVKAIVNYQLRWSAIHTLSKKHKSSSQQVIQKYGKNLVVTRDGKTVTSFLSVEEIKKHRKGFLEIDPVPPETLIDVLYTRMRRRRQEEKKLK